MTSRTRILFPLLIFISYFFAFSAHFFAYMEEFSNATVEEGGKIQDKEREREKWKEKYREKKEYQG